MFFFFLNSSYIQLTPQKLSCKGEEDRPPDDPAEAHEGGPGPRLPEEGEHAVTMFFLLLDQVGYSSRELSLQGATLRRPSLDEATQTLRGKKVLLHTCICIRVCLHVLYESIYEELYIYIHIYIYI